MAFRQGLMNPYGIDPRYPSYPYVGFNPQFGHRPPTGNHFVPFSQQPPMNHGYSNWPSPHGYPSRYSYSYPNDYGYGHSSNYPPTWSSSRFGPEYTAPPVQPPPPPSVARPPFSFDTRYTEPHPQNIPPGTSGPTTYPKEWHDMTADRTGLSGDHRPRSKRQTKRRKSKPRQAQSKENSPLIIEINTHRHYSSRENYIHGRKNGNLHSPGGKTSSREEEKIRDAKEYMQAASGYRREEPAARGRTFGDRRRWEEDGSTYQPGLASRVNSNDSSSTLAFALIEAVNKIMEGSSREETLASSPRVRLYRV